MKKLYDTPEVEEVTFSASGIIAASKTLEDLSTEDDPNAGWGPFN